MRKYETVLISDPDLSDQSRSELLDKVRNIITNEKGILLDLDEWGNKKLAYEIKKKLRGYYICATYGGDGELVKELERNFRLTDDVLKFMTIVLSEDTTAEKLQKEFEENRPVKEETVESDESETEEADSEEEPEPAAEEETKEVETAEEEPRTEEETQ